MFGPLIILLITWPLVLSLRCFVGDCSQEDIFNERYMCYFARDEERNVEMCGGYHKMESKSIKNGDCLLNQVVDDGYGGAQSMSTQCFCDNDHLCNVKSNFPAFSKLNPAIVKRSKYPKCYEGTIINGTMNTLKETECLLVDDPCFFEYNDGTREGLFGCTYGSAGRYCLGKRGAFCNLTHVNETTETRCCCDTEPVCNGQWIVNYTTPIPPPSKIKCYAGGDCTDKVECDGICYYGTNTRSSRVLKVEQNTYCGCVPKDKDWCKNFPETQCNFNHYVEIPRHGYQTYKEFCCCADELCNKKSNFPALPSFQMITECWKKSIVTGLEKMHCKQDDDGQMPKSCSISFYVDYLEKIYTIVDAGCGCQWTVGEIGCTSGGPGRQHCCCTTNMCNDKTKFLHYNSKGENKFTFDPYLTPPKTSDHRKNPSYDPVDGGKHKQHDRFDGKNKASKIGLAPMLLLMVMAFVIGE